MTAPEVPEVCQVPWCDRPGGYPDDQGRGTWCPWHASSPSALRPVPPATAGGASRSAATFVACRSVAEAVPTRKLRRLERRMRRRVRRGRVHGPGLALWAATRAVLRARGVALPDA